MIYVGIDIGLNGAIAYITDEGCITIYDMPTLSIKSGPKTKNILDPTGFVDCLRPCVGKAHVAFELVASRPLQSSVSTFSFGYSAGMVEMACVALGIPYTKVRPQEWKKLTMPGMGAEKEASVARALQVWPELRSQLITPRGAKKDGRADALLIAWWCQRLISISPISS